MKNYSALLVILMLLIAYRLTNLQGKLNDVSDAVHDFQQQASMRWPRNGLLDHKEYLVDSALGSLSITWDASERLAQYQVDWPVGPTRTINSLLNYAARNVSGSGNLATSLAAYSFALWAFSAEMANAEAGCTGCGNYARRQEIKAKISDSVASSARRFEMQGYARTLLEELNGYRPPAGRDNGHALLGRDAQMALDKILGPQWRAEHAEVVSRLVV